MDYPDKTERLLSSESVYRGKILDLDRDTVAIPNGRTATREIVHHHGAVAIAAIDKDGRLLLVKQYRYAAGRELLEVPAGKLEPGENPDEAAVRELREETGASAEKLTPLGYIFSACGYSDEKIHFYLAQGLSFGETDPDEDEFIDLVPMSLEKASELAETGMLPDAKTQCVLLRLHLLAARGDISI